MSIRRFATELDLTHVDESFRTRFWSKVDTRGADDCWPWMGYCKPNGYGQFVASRVALALSIGGRLAAGLVACHRCDNPPCCNPGHLFAGSPSDNALDSVQKGRARRARGVDTASAVLTEAEVQAIRATPLRYGTKAALATQYGVSDTTIRRILRRQIWRHVA